MVRNFLQSLFPLFLLAPDDGGGSGGSGSGTGDGGDGGEGGGAGAGDGGGGKGGATPPEGDELGDAGKKALDEERRARKAAEKAQREATKELEELRKQQMTDQEKAVAEAKAAGKAEALTVANERLVRAEVTTAATGKLTNPALAARLLDLDDFEVSDDGEVDQKAITAAVDRLVKENPELASGTRKPGKLPGSGGSTPDAAQSMNDWIRGQAGVASVD